MNSYKYRGYEIRKTGYGWLIVAAGIQCFTTDEAAEYIDEYIGTMQYIYKEVDT